LHYCDVAFKQKGTLQLRLDVRAATYVYVAAAVEAYITTSLAALVTEINLRAVPYQHLRLSLFAIAHAPHLSALQDVRGLKMWTRRCDIFSDVDSTAIATLDSAHLPLDGGTIRPSHMDAIWRVVGLPGDSTPGHRHRLALTDVADNRNAVAHGEEDAATVAGRKGIPDLLRLLERVEECVLHVHYGMNDYLDGATYLR